MSATMERLFEKVEHEIYEAQGIAWDGCHKIYLAMDDEQADWFADNYEYYHHYIAMDAREMLATVREWYESSCGLRFVNAVYTNEEDPNAGFVTLIGQFADDDYEEED